MRFILANRALAEAHGTTVEGLLGKTVHDLGVDPEEARHFAEDDLEVIRTGRQKQIPEERFTDARGRERYLQTTKIPFTFSDSPAMLGVAPEKGRHLRVLLIDDEEVVREMVAEVLEHEDLEVLIAADGERGLELMGECGGVVDVVLLDLSMPGLSGQDTFARLAERHPGVPVILSSGHDHAEAMRRFEGRAPAGFIQKPYRPQQLLAEIHRCVGGGGDSAEPGAH